MIRKTYDEDFPPKTTLQSQLVGAAKLVEHRMQVYHKNQQANPTVKKPFCLRYPTYIDVIKHSISSEDKCEVLPGDVMVILIDEGGICIGVGLPPKPQSTKSLHVPRDVRAREQLDRFVVDNVLQSNEDSVIRSSHMSNQFPVSTLPLSLDTKGEVRAGEGAKKSTVSYQAYGYGLGSVLRTKPSNVPPMISRKKSYRATGTIGNPNLNPIFRNLFVLKPVHGHAGLLNFDTICSVKEVNGLEDNVIIAARTVSVNTLPNTHRDKKNALLMDSVFFFGNHLGGQFLLPSLGLAYPGDIQWPCGAELPPFHQLLDFQPTKKGMRNLATVDFGFRFIQNMILQKLQVSSKLK
ncbi:hypothetical protein PtA15_6A101 [Puccinia triticina]|uniref:Uncharacterized protein n=1 Tax=Puccinia triticina TaxID=208348 RepID=A0ABY7CKM9_9BASI|nr:uncharacterized protein PtA15_6A101 [Puccinia triticina]WAQ85473.1 hypothetical protein PtA15_6A101 [Puccinia triticina]